MGGVLVAATSLEGVWFALYQDPYHPEDGIGAKASSLAMFLIVAAVLGRGIFGQNITASPDGLLIQGMVMKTRVHWSDFQSVRPSSTGLVFTRTDGSMTVASAVVKADIWKKHQTRADRIANEITFLAQEWVTKPHSD